MATPPSDNTPPMKPTPRAGLVTLLTDLFSSAASISSFVRSYTGIDLVARALPGDNVPVVEMADALVTRLQEHGLATREFFDELALIRPFRLADVRQVAAAWGLELLVGPGLANPWKKQKSTLEELRGMGGLPRQLAKLLDDVDSDTLPLLLEIAEAVHVLNHRFVVLMAGEMSNGPVSYMIAPGQEPVFLSSSITTFRRLLDLLVSHRMASHWGGMGSVHNKAPGLLDSTMQHLGTIEGHQGDAWVALRQYLESARRVVPAQAPSTGKRSESRGARRALSAVDVDLAIARAIFAVDDELNEIEELGTTITIEAIVSESGASPMEVRAVVAELEAKGILRTPTFGRDGFVLTEKAKKWRQRLGV